MCVSLLTFPNKESHPGGYEILLMNAKEGNDPTSEFEDIKHSDEARAKALTLKVGKLEGTTKPFPTKLSGLKGSMAKRIQDSSGKDLEDPSNPFLVGAILAGLAASAYYVFTKKRG